MPKRKRAAPVEVGEVIDIKPSDVEVLSDHAIGQFVLGGRSAISLRINGGPWVLMSAHSAAQIATQMLKTVAMMEEDPAAGQAPQSSPPDSPRAKGFQN